MSSPLSGQHPWQRDLVLLRTPSLWSSWPFFPVARWFPDGQERQLGVLYDAGHAGKGCPTLFTTGPGPS
jgi:hypothetical protein